MRHLSVLNLEVDTRVYYAMLIKYWLYLLVKWYQVFKDYRRASDWLNKLEVSSTNLEVNYGHDQLSVRGNRDS